jgi:hypothetical protein
MAEMYFVHFVEVSDAPSPASVDVTIRSATDVEDAIEQAKVTLARVIKPENLSSFKVKKVS